MAYQSNFSETGFVNNVNVGRSNSARGEGTTTSELLTKVRSMNCAACLSVLIFHTVPRVLNPIQLVTLLSSPIRLIIEILVASLALSLLLVEARIPVLGERVILYVRGIAVGGIPVMDLNMASGRVLALITMSGLLALANLITIGFLSTLSYGHGEPTTSSSSSAELTNTSSANNTQSEFGGDTMAGASSGPSMLFIFIQCTLFSPTIFMLVSLIAYTIYLMHEYPEFAQSMAHECLPPSESSFDAAGARITPVAETGRPSWVSNILNNVNTRGDGYQSLDV